MLRWRGLDAVPSGWGQSVVTIGVFDGVHRGHRQIIGRAVEKAASLQLPSVVVTFDPHPSEVVRPGSHPAQLTTTRFKAELVESLGADVMCVVPFTLDLSRTPPEEFVHQVLVERLQSAAVVVGENFRFGHKASGDVPMLAQLGSRFGFTVEGVPLVRTGGDDTVYSSTLVRTLVAAGDMTVANAALCRDHRVEGLVVRGDQRGRELGYPTANLRPTPHAAVPADGVYAGYLITLADGVKRPAAISVGTNPTFEGRERRVEAFVLDFTGDLYGLTVGFEFTQRLRPMLKFDDKDALVEQMNKDVEDARRIVAAA